MRSIIRLSAASFIILLFAATGISAPPLRSFGPTLIPPGCTHDLTLFSTIELGMLDVGAMKVSGISSETIPQDEARRLIERFRDAQDITTKRILAMQISNDYAARLLLKK